MTTREYVRILNNVIDLWHCMHNTLFWPLPTTKKQNTTAKRPLADATDTDSCRLVLKNNDNK